MFLSAKDELSAKAIPSVYMYVVRCRLNEVVITSEFSGEKIRGRVVTILIFAIPSADGFLKKVMVNSLK